MYFLPDLAVLFLPDLAASFFAWLGGVILADLAASFCLFRRRLFCLFWQCFFGCFLFSRSTLGLFCCIFFCFSQRYLADPARPTFVVSYKPFRFFALVSFLNDPTSYYFFCFSPFFLFFLLFYFLDVLQSEIWREANSLTDESLRKLVSRPSSFYSSSPRPLPQFRNTNLVGSDGVNGQNQRLEFKSFRRSRCTLRFLLVSLLLFLFLIILVYLLLSRLFYSIKLGS